MVEEERRVASTFHFTPCLLSGVQSQDSTDRVAISASRQVKLGSSRAPAPSAREEGQELDITEPIALDAEFPRPVGHSASCTAQGLAERKLSYQLARLCSGPGVARAPLLGASPAPGCGCPRPPGFCSARTGTRVAEVTSEAGSGPDSLLSLVKHPPIHMSFLVAVLL